MGEKYAVDIKSTYRIDGEMVNGMTLGAFTGYFQDRSSRKNITFPYQDYKMHLVLGILYSKADDVIDERKIYVIDETKGRIVEEEAEQEEIYERLDSLERISSVVRDFTFFVQPKYRIASYRPGSGNTKNIGSVTKIDQLLNGTGPFYELGEDVYDDYWMHYMTKDMAEAAKTTRPYINLKTYAEYKKRGANLDLAQVEQLQMLDMGMSVEDQEEPE